MAVLSNKTFSALGLHPQNDSEYLERLVKRPISAVYKGTAPVFVFCLSNRTVAKQKRCNWCQFITFLRVQIE